ncbi:MAG: hypothetical protein A2Y10_19525 [Planctomycetes bacterium GWF2_41_51]|nr:MAG: hypothetical protein A2Y10_19525 [Planctomycetes bacterium GWF2_41_51]HBG28171.1 hypothetical protein [Phycisphaerales bacterium]
MIKKYTLLIGLLLPALISSTWAVSAAKIDAVRNKETIADTDSAVIEEFLSEVFTELFAKSDFSDAAALRTSIISKSTSANQSGQILYGPKYISAAEGELSKALKKVNALADGNRKTILTTNLLLIINDLANYETSKLALDYLGNPNVMIRYWAVNSVTNPNVVKQLNENSEDARNNFAQKLLKTAQAEQSSDILIILAQSADIKAPAVNEILTTIAQKRVDLYLSWNVSDEITDEAVLKALADRSKANTESTKTMGKYFATLYSLMIQRYVLGEQTLNEAGKTSLISAIAQSERNMTAFVPDWNANFRRAIEKGGASALLIEHDVLFGSAGAAGKLPAAIGFDYGKNADGSAITVPPVLSKPIAAK